ncbi:hypothetical protein [Aerosakkonema funiforme]|uniref:hypothetical protein n=1 Tax=Aerosakkonema funiforme TaxID=1246630 RepID=UPI001683B12B|nr:hypothetical protein [Aerosakkonema funiforme]
MSPKLKVCYEYGLFQYDITSSTKRRFRNASTLNEAQIKADAKSLGINNVGLEVQCGFKGFENAKKLLQ